MKRKRLEYWFGFKIGNDNIMPRIPQELNRSEKSSFALNSSFYKDL